jgi:hypothetical protein
MKWLVPEYAKNLPIRISFCQSSDTIEIKTLLKKDDFIKSSLHFQKTNLTFGNGSKICPEDNCSYEFEKTTVDEGVLRTSISHYNRFSNIIYNNFLSKLLLINLLSEKKSSRKFAIIKIITN